MFDYKIYQNQEFLQILEDVYQIEKVKIFEDEQLNNITTFYQSKKKKGNIFNMPFNFYYTPHFSEENKNVFFDQLNKFSIQNNSNIVIKSLIKYDDFHYVSQNMNSILDVSKVNSYEAYFNSLRKNFRQNIRTSYNKLPNDIEFKIINNINELELFYITLSELYIDKHKMVFQPFDLYRKLFESGIAKYFVYKKNNQILSAIVIIEDENKVHYNWGITHNDYYKYSLNTLLVNEMIKHYFDKNIQYVDFGATPNSDEKLLYFKSRWGCEHYSVYEYYTLNKPLEIDLNNSYKLPRNIYSKFPKPFLRWLMPKIVPWLVH
ncbi:GNAT family N-acetyltransferase [Candidatus Marinarcus aquaticus]|uniref:BioF2-like acetyltransferase domain-containing protein n=1 Tax=Candidatus Marinarcus aquaticus TaxID=2044504 RepID=A0A4Q0XN43_9BACT|nr:GNAT family N-acetyltransferase [Candidatus Marinarcus aquaticus]RXJ54421.1 hypothetical protein CRV04_11550 [Candidatus Marinarcus aquaticus]